MGQHKRIERRNRSQDSLLLGRGSKEVKIDQNFSHRNNEISKSVLLQRNESDYLFFDNLIRILAFPAIHVLLSEGQIICLANNIIVKLISGIPGFM